MSQRSRIEALLRLPPRWAVLLGLVADAAVAAWRGVSDAGAPEPRFFLLGLLWPGLAVFIAVYVFAWLGWALDIDR